MKPSSESLAWLYRLDSYTNTEFGRARTLSAIRDECVSCGRGSTKHDERGLCRDCAAQLNADTTPIDLFRPMLRTTGT